MNICVYGAASRSIAAKHIENVERLGEKLAERGHSLIFGGGANGAMGAAARGALKGKAAKIIAIIPKFFNVDGVLFDGCTEVVYTDTMSERKKLLEDYSDAFIITPGGVGTFDEFFEILSLKQLARMNKPIVIYNSLGYYDPLIELLNKAIEGNFMSAKNMELFKVTDDIDEVFNYIDNYDKSEILKLTELKDVTFNVPSEKQD